MSIRVDEHEVQLIVDVPSGEDMSLFIEVASRYVDNVFSTTTLAADQLRDIELYLSAHLATLTIDGGGVSLERIGSSSIQYAQLRGDKLYLTRFGQLAMMLDTTGKLVASSKEKARFRSFGAATS